MKETAGKPFPPPPPLAFLVGPEGGWSPEEDAMFDAYGGSGCGSGTRDRNGVVNVSLGTTVLRAETAAMMAVGAWALDDAAAR